MLLYDAQGSIRKHHGILERSRKCLGCKYSLTLQVGVGESNGHVSSETWADSFSESSSTKAGFGFGSVSQTLSYQQSHAITESSSHAFTKSAAYSLIASCGDGKGDYTMYQWQMAYLENCNYGFCPGNIYTRIYLCKEHPGPPMCIPDECADAECETCIPLT